MALRITSKYTQLPGITTGPISDTNWNALASDVRYLHETGQLSGSASARGGVFLASRTTNERFFPVVLFPGYRRAVLKLRLNLTRSANIGTIISETVTVKLWRSGQVQNVRAFYISTGTTTVIDGGYPLTNQNTVNVFLEFQISPSVIPVGNNAEVGRISFEYDGNANLAPAVASGINSFQLQTFAECP